MFLYVVALTLYALTIPPEWASAVYIRGGSGAYAQYPKWNACRNASIAFDFQTARSKEEGLLMYVDDGGNFDFMEVTHRFGRVRVVLNIVDGHDGNVDISPDVTGVNDGKWHSVKIQRNLMQTIVTVDGVDASRTSFGSDPYFGQHNNSFVYFGGLPNYYGQEFRFLALPTAWFQPKFKGAIRNVIYNNCTCQSERVPILAGVGVDMATRESCDVRNPCEAGCLCVSRDFESLCDCSSQHCDQGETVVATSAASQLRSASSHRQL